MVHSTFATCIDVVNRGNKENGYSMHCVPGNNKKMNIFSHIKISSMLYSVMHTVQLFGQIYL